MKTLALHIFIIIIHLITGETEKFQHSLVVGKVKISCQFAMVFQGTKVDLKKSKVRCTRPKKDLTVRAYKINPKESGNLFIISMTIKKQSGRGIFKQVILKLGSCYQDCYREPAGKKGILVTGGRNEPTDRSVEVFIPDSGETCSLPSLPDARWYHTMDTLSNTPVICGGGDVTGATPTSCIHLTPTSASGGWTNYATTEERRFGHISWVSSAGLVLMGGGTTEIAGAGANISLAQYTSPAGCGITDKDSIIITGAYSTNKVVARYNLQGHVENLPEMTQGRYDHGCGSFYRGNKMVLVVAGGLDDGGYHLSSTEQLTIGAAAWTTAKPLPRAVAYVATVSMNNKIYLLGGRDDDFEYSDYGDYGDYQDRSEILEFDGEDWKEVGQLQSGRAFHAATVIATDNLGVCN